MPIVVLRLSLWRSRQGLDNVGDGCYSIYSLEQEVENDL